MTHATFDERIAARVSRGGEIEPRPQSFLARALFGNVALLSGLVAMPLLILVGYLVQGQI